MKIYLAGPMRGYRDFNFPAFNAAAKRLRAQGHEVFNPAERDEKEFGEIKNKSGDEQTLARDVGMTVDQLRRHVFEQDMTWICRHAEVVALLPDWEDSKGARAERALAIALGLDVWEDI